VRSPSCRLRNNPEIVPPTVQVTTTYPGAFPRRPFRRAVATPLEQQINGVEDMLYLSSQSTGDGKLTINRGRSELGPTLNVAQMLTQNRVQGRPCPGCPRMCSDSACR